MSEAESDLEAATSAQPNFPEAHYWLGRVYLAENRPQAARDEFKTAVAQRSDNYPDARFYQGIAEEQLGQRTEALASFKTALAQGGDSAWASDARAALARLGSP
jgi:tetratricopeptide (TPR) repeat protein